MRIEQNILKTETRNTIKGILRKTKDEYIEKYGHWDVSKWTSLWHYISPEDFWGDEIRDKVAPWPGLYEELMKNGLFVQPLTKVTRTVGLVISGSTLEFDDEGNSMYFPYDVGFILFEGVEF